MIKIKRSFLLILGILFFIFSPKYSYSETQNIYELLELIQKDLRTLEKAVYSDNFSAKCEPKKPATPVTKIFLDGLFILGFVYI